MSACFIKLRPVLRKNRNFSRPHKYFEELEAYFIFLSTSFLVTVSENGRVKKIQSRNLVRLHIYSYPQLLTASNSGGGIGGLVCALAISQHSDIDVDIFESAKSFTEVGAGIGMMIPTLGKLGLTHIRFVAAFMGYIEEAWPRGRAAASCPTTAFRSRR